MTRSFDKKSISILESIIYVDQNAIKEFRDGVISVSKLIEINNKNVKTIKDVITSIGFPYISLTSPKAYRATILVVLHSADLELIKSAIDFLNCAKPDDVERKDLAFLHDKWRVTQGLPQLYGTQYKIDQGGQIKFVDIDDQRELDKRRTALGMETFEEYRKKVQDNLGD